MVKARRMGPRDSESSHALLDAAERILRDEGYAAATSRRIAEVAGLKPQLVYYYFKTIDDLLLAAFQRRAERGRHRFANDTLSQNPLRALWTDYNRSTDARLSFEYMALANRHDGIRAEVTKFVDESRQLQADAIAKVPSMQKFHAMPLTAAGLAFLISCISLQLRRESDTGARAGHADIEAFVDWVIQQFD